MMHSRFLKKVAMRPNSMRLHLIIGIAVMALAAGSVMLAQAPTLVARFTAVTSNVSGAGDIVRIEMLKWSTDAERDQFLNAFLHRPVPAPAAAPAAAPAPAPGAGGGGGGRGRGRGGAARGADAANPPATPPANPPTADGATPPAAAPPAAGAAAAAGRGAGRGAAGRGGAAPAAAAAAGAPPLPDDAPAAGRGGGRGGAVADAVPETPESSLAATLQKANTVGFLWTSESAGYSIKYAYRVTGEGGERIIFATDRRLGVWSDQWWKPTGTAAPTNLPVTVFELRFPATGDGEGRTTLTAKILEDKAAESIAVENYSAQPIVFKTVKKVKP